MRKIFIISILYIISSNVTSQEIKILANYSNSGYQKFRSNWGYQVAYDQYTEKQHKYGIGFSQSFYHQYYEYIFASDADGIDYYRKAQAKNSLISTDLHYLFQINSTKNSTTYIGPGLSFNFFHIDEEIEETEYQTTSEVKIYNLNYWDILRPGLGFIIEYEHQVSDMPFFINFSTFPQIIFYTMPNTKGSSTPTFVPLISVNLGLSYRFGNE